MENMLSKLHEKDDKDSQMKTHHVKYKIISDIVPCSIYKVSIWFL